MSKLNYLRVALAVALFSLCFVGVLLPGSSVLADVPTKYEYFDSGDTDSDPIAGVNVTAMQFTVGTSSHTMSSVRLSLKRVGVPGYTYLALREADSGLPVGYDLAVSDAVASLTLPTAAYTWLEFPFDDYTLEAGETYALYLYAADGDVDNYVLWEGKAAGGLADAVGSHSLNSGVTWTSDTPVDYLFEVYGATVMEISDVDVFHTFLEDDDWLFTIRYYNNFEPYSETEFAGEYFIFQLLSPDTNDILAQTNMRAWEYRVGSIYLNPNEAGLLEWGAAYVIRMYGLFGSNPYVDYTLESADWQGAELLLLDHWVYTAAQYIENMEETTLLIEVAPGTRVLNSAGHVIFIVGIPYLATIRPDLFEASVQSLVPDDKSFNVTTTDMTTELGPDLVGFLDDGRTFLGVSSAKEMGTVVGLGAGIAVLALMAALGYFFVGIAVVYIGLVTTTMVGITDWAVLGLVTFGAVVVWVFAHFASK